MRVTFAEFSQSGRYVADLGRYVDDICGPGRLYLGCYWLAQLQSGEWATIVGNAEITDSDLDACERWLWSNVFPD